MVVGVCAFLELVSERWQFSVSQVSSPQPYPGEQHPGERQPGQVRGRLQAVSPFESR